MSRDCTYRIALSVEGHWWEAGKFKGIGKRKNTKAISWSAWLAQPDGG